jgi:hypothetical protein
LNAKKTDQKPTADAPETDAPAEDTPATDAPKTAAIPQGHDKGFIGEKPEGPDKAAYSQASGPSSPSATG